MNFNDVIGINNHEKPLDNLISDGGFCGVFRTVACIGDSLSSGEFEGTDEKGNKTYHDYYEYSWGQYMARIAGFKAYNFSCGGMSARQYCESFADNKDLWNVQKACQAYIIALGVNDVTGILKNEYELGSIKDIDDNNYENNKSTFAGYYAKIIQRYKQIQPDAKFFLVTMPKDGTNDERAKFYDMHASLLYEFSEYFSNTYIIDLRKYAPVYDENYSKAFRLGGHLNPAGYLLTAKMMVSYIDYIIRHNMKDFKQIGFVGTPYKNTVDI